METRLKERLTGAAILVALIVLLVPEMFHGRGSDVAANAGSSGEGPPVRSYTIDLSNGPARTAPLQSTPTAAANPAESNNAAGSSAAAVSPEPPPSAAASTTAASPSNAAASAPSSPRASASRPSSARATAAAAHAGGPWSVQLGLFASRDNAERLLHTAQGKGFTPSLSERDAKGLYHVQVAGLADRAAAQALQQRLRDQGFAAAVMAPAAGAKGQP